MRRARAALALIAALTLTGCVYFAGPMPQPGIHTPLDGLYEKSKAQLLDETTENKAELLDASLQQANEIALAVGGRWLDDHQRNFDPTNIEQRSAWSWNSCDEEARTGQYIIYLRQPNGHDTLGHGADPGFFNTHATAGHGYLDNDTEAVHNTAAAALGVDGLINGGTRSIPHRDAQ